MCRGRDLFQCNGVGSVVMGWVGWVCKLFVEFRDGWRLSSASERRCHGDCGGVG
jgi:hypothetical protein